ncbi:MAG: hypothetical protein ACREQV_24425 [Candidatus Binatia bacterium]
MRNIKGRLGYLQTFALRLLRRGYKHVLELVRYLHLNPQRMRLPMQAATYRWSSHGAYMGKDNPVKIETAPVLGEFAKTVGKARVEYLKFMADGKATGHQPDYYNVRDQRFLGDERFVAEIEERVEGDREIAVPVPRVKLTALLPLVARAYGATERELVQAGRQRKWLTARSMLVYLSREWGRVSVKELGKRLHRDPSVISRLYASYAAGRDKEKETFVLQQLRP